MTVTRANVENVSIHRTGPLMAKAGMDGTTVDGTNADLASPIAWALRQAGYSVADITNPTTSEVASASDDVDEVLDLTELRVLEDIMGSLDDVDVTVGPRKEALSQLATQVQKRIKSVQDRVEKTYGFGAAALETGTITYQFAEHFSGSENDE
ncbi:hypothetical protein LCGC14_0561840 [marine sediment metagenome]|uniref:Uncharacterized protein n=1 Tax=marine sediment metagenome TaxID=412755 RepID=A0A0F9S5F7_9ZZZZ